MKRKKSNEIFSDGNVFDEQIKNVAKDLYYISETDSEIFSFVGERCESVSVDNLLRQLKRKDSVEERNFEDFFKRLTEMQEWFGDEETAAASKFSELRELLLKYLKDLKIFKIGKIEVDIYIVGMDENNILKGVRTKAVET